MKKLLTAIFAMAVLVAGCITINVAPTPTQMSRDNVYTWGGDVALVNLTAIDGNGTCTGWMFTDTLLVTAGHCTEQLLSATACFYPDVHCEHPVIIKLRGADLVHDVGVFTLPEGVKKRPFPVRTRPLTPGETVYAVGFPDGEFGITNGIYSQRQPETDLWDAVVTEWLQHSAPIAPGSSGGTLLDSDGAIVGMTIGVRTIGRNAPFYFFGIAAPADIICQSVFAISVSPLPPPVVGVAGEATITRVNP